MLAPILLLAGLAWQQSSVPELKFPTDTRKPTATEAKEFLETICPGHVVIGETFECDVPCPKHTDFAGEKIRRSLDAVTRGHFLSPTSDDAVLAVSGCESHANNFGGTILLTREQGRWKIVWDKGGVPTTQCHRVLLPTRREVLICLGSFGGQGFVGVDLYVEDMTKPATSLMSGGKDSYLWEGKNTVGTCGYNGEDESKPFDLRLDYLERIQFNNAPDGTIRSISVFGRRGKRRMTAKDSVACINEQVPTRPHKGLTFAPSTAPYRVNFVLDGSNFRRVTDPRKK